MTLYGEGHHAGELATSPAEVETSESYLQNIAFYQKQDYTYIPIPAANLYYDIHEGMLFDMQPEQHIKFDEPLYGVFERLQEHPFLLVSPMGRNKAIIKKSQLIGIFSLTDDGYRWLRYESQEDVSGRPPSPHTFEDKLVYDVHSVESEFPEIAREVHHEPYDNRYGIITLADLNRRYTKDALYPLVAELAYLLSLKIEKEYESEDVLKHIRPGTVGRWFLAKQEGIHMHIVEQMTLSEMEQVVRSSDSEFVEECGFPSKNKVNEKLGSINQLRNKVMHANRTLVRDRVDLEKLLERLDTLEEVVMQLRETVDHELA